MNSCSSFHVEGQGGALRLSQGVNVVARIPLPLQKSTISEFLWAWFFCTKFLRTWRFFVCAGEWRRIKKPPAHAGPALQREKRKGMGLRWGMRTGGIIGPCDSLSGNIKHLLRWFLFTEGMKWWAIYTTWQEMSLGMEIVCLYEIRFFLNKSVFYFYMWCFVIKSQIFHIKRENLKFILFFLVLWGFCLCLECCGCLRSEIIARWDFRAV